MAVDIIARGLAANGLAGANLANQRLDMLPNGMVYIGEVNYYNDLPNDAEVGSVYSVKYSGESGSNPDGTEYVYGLYEGENQWIKLGAENCGSVESVSAGTGLTISGDPTINPTIEVDSDYKLPSTAEWADTATKEDVAAVHTYKEYNDTWPTNGTTKALMAAVNADETAVPGNVYLGDVRLTDMPFAGNAELVISVIGGSVSQKVVLATLTSGNVAPYHWEYTYWNGTGTGWKSFIPNEYLETTLTDSDSKVPTSGAVVDALATKQDVITPENKIDAETDIEGLSSVALSGSYNDLENLPEEATDQDIDDLFPEEVATFADIQTLNNDPTVTKVNVQLTDDINAGNSDMVFTKDAKIDLNGHTMTFGDWGFEIKNGKTLTVENGTINASEAPFYAREGATLIINNGTYSSTNNYVIGTSGSIGKGNNTITVNGGTFTSTMSAAGQEAGYIACGVYVANNDTVEIKGGTFNVTDGVGVCARSGHTIIDEGVIFNVTGEGKSGYVGDSKVIVPAGKEIVLDLKAKYPGGTPTVDNYTSYTVYTLSDE